MLTVLALSLTLVQPEHGPASPSAETGVVTAYDSWLHCVVGAARTRAAEAVAPEAIGEEAVAGCAARESAWREAYAGWLGAEHRDPAGAGPMNVVARCHMVRRGAQAAIAHRPPGPTRITSRESELDRRCREAERAAAPPEASH